RNPSRSSCARASWSSKSLMRPLSPSRARIGASKSSRVDAASFLSIFSRTGALCFRLPLVWCGFVDELNQLGFVDQRVPDGCSWRLHKSSAQTIFLRARDAVEIGYAHLTPALRGALAGLPDGKFCHHENLSFPVVVLKPVYHGGKVSTSLDT